MFVFYLVNFNYLSLENKKVNNLVCINVLYYFLKVFLYL